MIVRFAFFAALLCAGAASAAAQTRDVFSVTVHVDATAANAAAAREEARAEGERDAYSVLMDRLTVARDQSRVPPADQALLDTLISGFEVANEHSSGVRYLADYTYHFQPAAVRHVLQQAQIPYCETPSKPAVVLPVLGGGATPLLWEDPNPWRDAWNAHPPTQGLVPLVVPNGDLQDVQTIDGPAALSGDSAKIAAISQRYAADDAMTSEAVLDTNATPHVLAVTTTRFTPGGAPPPQTFTKTYAAQPDESDDALFADAVAGTENQVEEAWKEANILDLSKSAVLVARVPTGSLDRFVAVQDRLGQVPAVAGSALLAIDRNSATIQIHYYGSPDQLRTALAQSDLTLGGQDPDWIIERASPVSQQPQP